jgi:dihydrofolate reductase
MSLDGFIAGPSQSVDNPLGVGGTRLHDWLYGLSAFRSMHGQEGGVTNESSPIVEESRKNIGATIMGRNMFGGQPGPWDAKKAWNGWWGKNPPFHHHVFVLTHHRRDPLRFDDGTTFTFITDGIENALDLAKRAAAGKDVALGGGAHVAQQYFLAGLIDQMEINLVPTMLGDGARLFDDLGDDMMGLRLERTVATPVVTHLKFVKKT